MKVFGRKIRVVFENEADGETIPVGAATSVSPDDSKLNIGFTVERSIDLEPSTLTMTIHNLSKDTQERLNEALKWNRTASGKGWTVSLSAGYGEEVHVIFKGDVRVVRHRREPPLLATDVEADDGGEASKRFVSRHFPKGTTVGTVFRWMQQQSGLGEGNVTRITQINTPDGLPDRLENGTTIRGYVMEEMGAMAESRGAILSSQNNEVVVLKPGEPLPGVPLTKISPDTGLIGYPYVDNEGLLILNHRLLPNVFPGAPIDVESEFVKGEFVVERAVYSGSIWEDDFNIEIEGRPVA